MNTPSFRNTRIAVGVAAALGVSAGTLAQSTESSQPKAHSETMSATIADMATPESIQPANIYLSSDLSGATVEHPGKQSPSMILRHLVVSNMSSVAHVIRGYGDIVSVLARNNSSGPSRR